MRLFGISYLALCLVVAALIYQYSTISLQLKDFTAGLLATIGLACLAATWPLGWGSIRLPRFPRIDPWSRT